MQVLKRIFSLCAEFRFVTTLRNMSRRGHESDESSMVSLQGLDLEDPAAPCPFLIRVLLPVIYSHAIVRLVPRLLSIPPTVLRPCQSSVSLSVLSTAV